LLGEEHENRHIKDSRKGTLLDPDLEMELREP
jgi:hypothetical protein